VKYKLKNVDCASCAANIESSLLKSGKFKQVSVDSATNILSIDTADISELQKQIKKVEPDVSVEIFNMKKSAETESSEKNKYELIRILIVVLIFVPGMYFRDDLHNTIFSWAEYLVFISAYLISGWGVVYKALRNLLHGKIFDEHFLMTIATIGAIVIHELPEAVAVMWFYNVGEFVEGLAVRRSRKSIKSLLEIRPESANVFRNGELINISPDEVAVGETIVAKPGEKIPLDGIVIEGTSFVDTYPLTGESVPRKFDADDEVFSGTINKTGLLKIKVNKPFHESSVSKILELVENASGNKAETEKFITKFAKYYTPLVVFTAIGIAVIPPLIFAGAMFEDWLYRALVILVISCPCALVISIPLGYFGGIGGASRRGILIKGSNYLDTLTSLKTIIFDKTGTLTKGVFKVTEVHPSNSYSYAELLELAAYAEYNSAHPIAKSILDSFDKPIKEEYISSFEELSGRGIKAQINGKKVIAGNDRMLHEFNIEHPICEVDGTVVHVAVNSAYAGYLIISDELKDEAKESVQLLKSEGVKKIKIFSGDNIRSTEGIAAKLGINDYRAELLPENKLSELEKVIKSSEKEEKVGFVGDGINDAPVIARADVGIAMGAFGSDAAIESADVVIMTDNLLKLPEAIDISRRTRQIVWENIIFALAVKGLFILLGGFGLASMWEAVFADMGVAIIAILNSTRVLRIK
jgi:Cd2+/Zn2+-exporting ATPase